MKRTSRGLLVGLVFLRQLQIGGRTTLSPCDETFEIGEFEVRLMSQIYRITLRLIKDDRQWWSLTRCDVRAGGKLLLG